jgi:hypothetical protein
MSKKKTPPPEFDPSLVELLAKAMDGHAFIRYKAGDVLPRGEEMSTPEKVNEVQVWRQRSAESRARQALRALRAGGYQLSIPVHILPSGTPVDDPMNNPWRSMDRAPKNCGWVDVRLPDGTVRRAHWASDLSGEHQPPFEGWFVGVPRTDGTHYNVQIEEPTAWRPPHQIKL